MISHRTQDAQNYEILCHGVQVAKAWKENGRFEITSDHLAESLSFRTMKELKEGIAPFLPEALRTAPEKPQKTKEKATYLSMKEAFTKCGMSHSFMAMTIREIRKIWPEMPKHRWGEYVVRRHMTAMAKWSWGTVAADRWLEENPAPEWWNPEEENRRIEKIYGQQPTWTN